MSAQTLTFECAFKTDVGQKRKQNQDNGCAEKDLALFMVADGMGGHQGGEIASELSVKALTDTIKQEHSLKLAPKALLKKALENANEMIFKKSQEVSALSGMGTTTTALIYRDGKLIVGHVGDSRCYFFTQNSLWQVTRDHSLVQEKVRAGLISREQAKSAKDKNVITRSVGYESETEIDLYEITVERGDLFLVCSDGLSGLVTDTDLKKILIDAETAKKSLDTLATELISTANKNGGDDNVTAVLVKFN